MVDGRNHKRLCDFYACLSGKWCSCHADRAYICGFGDDKSRLRLGILVLQRIYPVNVVVEDIRGNAAGCINQCVIIDDWLLMENVTIGGPEHQHFVYT